MKYFLLIPALIYMGCSRPPAAPPATGETLATIRCADQTLPTFGINIANPSEQEQSALCECVWSRLADHDRKLAASLRNQRQVSSSSMESFPIRWGKAIGTCSSAAGSAGAG